VDARFSGRHPFELFTLFLCVITALPTVLRLTPAPSSINMALPHWLVIAWSITLLVGSVAALLGVYWRDRRTGLITEQFGLAVTGAAALIYAGCIIAVGTGGVIPAGIVGGFGLACLWRWKDLQRIIDEAVAYERLRSRGND
jgi:CHASE2 domain-containing sensor protein